MSFVSPISVAPMIDWTDRNCRHFHRVISGTAVLYTEMIVDKAIIHGDRERLLAGDRERVVLQIGGSEARELADATKIAFDMGYTDINLNCGCPSDRVQSGTFGAVLMRDPAKTARGLEAMVKASGAQISVKCRLGVDDQDVEKTLPAFLRAVEDAGVTDVILHARKAWLKGLSPKENRDIPPLDYNLAAEMVNEFPKMRFAINGGIGSLDEARNAVALGFDQAMIGRAAYHQPYDILAGVDDGAPKSRAEIVEEMVEYARAHIEAGGKLHQVTRHMLGLYHGQPGARGFRHKLSSEAVRDGALPTLIRDAMPEGE